MNYTIVKNASKQEVEEALDGSGEWYFDIIEINGMFNVDKIDFLLENIDRIDLDQLKQLIK